MLTELFYSVFVVLISLLLIAGGFTFIISPTAGKKVFEKALHVLLVFVAASVALEQLLARFPFLTWVVLTSAAYAVWTLRHPGTRPTPPQHRGAERTPVLPSSEHAE